MALNDFGPANGFEGAPLARRYQTKAGNTAINAGEMVIQGTAGDVEYVTTIADGASDSSIYVGVAATTDTVTAGADGEVWVYDNPNYTFRGLATTPANLATTIINTQVTFDVTSTVQTIDENDTANGVVIITGYNVDEGSVDFKIAYDDHISKG